MDAFSKICILDGYVDEPSLLGVPPYISPYPRYILGAIDDALGKTEHEVFYTTIDRFRADFSVKERVFRSTFLILIAGCLVPGKYLSGSPISMREIGEIAREASRRGSEVLLTGGVARYRLTGQPFSGFVLSSGAGDPDAGIFDLITRGQISQRKHLPQERAKWSVLGASVVKQHPNFPQRLIAEVETYRGCVRFKSGGCVFCMEPAQGEPDFRSPKEVVAEVSALYKLGVDKFRIGGQSCIFSYGTKELGVSETPRPNPEAVEELFSGLRSACPNISVLHVDNANPAVIAEHPKESLAVAKSLVKHCTSGNVVAFGLESADLEVYKKANLNATPEQTLKATRLLNLVGSAQGQNGMPALLPGINFLFGLPGESKATYDMDREFLEGLLKEKLLTRRINIRQVAKLADGEPFVRVDRREFMRFKTWAREHFDQVQLKRMLPTGTILKDIYIEMHEGSLSFGRQIGSYPLLVGFQCPLPQERFDGWVVEYGARSITCLRYPLPVNKASLRELNSVPGIGNKRAASLVRYRPFKDWDDLASRVELDKAVFDYRKIFDFSR